ncbi:MAG: hypothetical protein PVH22_01805 [Desulfobacteraceae bacterium]|jgi:hypothetical protein
MNRSAKQMSLIIGSVVIFFMLNGCGSPSPTSANTAPIDTEEGYIAGDVDESEVIPAEDGVLEGVIPMTEFECSGRVYKLKKDHQDGFSHSVTLVFGRLASPDVFKYLVDDGAMNKPFDDGFVLNKQYFKSHIATFYVHSATDNLEKAIKALKVGDPIRLKGDFVYLKTKNGLVKTSLNPVEFKCKYIYLTEIVTVESIYN